jgi:hypothetical protein
MECLDEENCQCRCMPGTFRCNSGPCLPMVIKSYKHINQQYLNLFSRDTFVMVTGNVLMVVMN